MIYGISIYSNVPECAIKEIAVKQKMAIRAITNGKYNEHTGPLFKKLRILPFEKLVEYFNLLFMFDYKHDKLPRSFKNTWYTRRERNVGYNLRNQNEYDISRFRTEYINRLPLCNLPRTWNEFPDHLGIKNIENRLDFKKKLKKTFVEQH